MRILSTALITLALVGYATCQSKPSGCNGVKNDYPVLDLPAQPLKTVPNGQSWMMSDGGSNYVYIAKLKGTPYEMGFAYGQLFSQEIGNNFQNLLAYGRIKLESLAEKYGVPSYLVDYIYTKVEPIIFEALDLNWNIALPFIPQRYIDELKGIADGTNGTVSEANIRRANMLPELIQAACTVLGVWGPAT